MSDKHRREAAKVLYQLSLGFALMAVVAVIQPLIFPNFDPRLFSPHDPRLIRYGAVILFLVPSAALFAWSVRLGRSNSQDGTGQ